MWASLFYVIRESQSRGHCLSSTHHGHKTVEVATLLVLRAPFAILSGEQAELRWDACILLRFGRSLFFVHEVNSGEL